MTPPPFPALLVSEASGGGFNRSMVMRRVDELPAGEVLVRVLFSSLNYKDALSATGNRGVTKRYPHVPGIDAAGIVEESTVPAFTPGDEVVVTGYELGSNHDGGFAGYVRVPAGWVVPRPAGLTLHDCMAFGTAGLTAALGVQQILARGVTPGDGPVAVSGASGGVGVMAVGILAREGFEVIASTGKHRAVELLHTMGAGTVVDRAGILETTGKPMVSGRWAAAVDTVGGPVLDSLLRQTKLFGAVAACGNVVSGEVHTSIYPFILRGVALLGINSAFTPIPLRTEMWRRLGASWKLPELGRAVTDVPLRDIDGWIGTMLQGGVCGRVVVHLGAER
jgi:acrylyl-CoA reductase (NADPH)